MSSTPGRGKVSPDSLLIPTLAVIGTLVVGPTPPPLPEFMPTPTKDSQLSTSLLCNGKLSKQEQNFQIRSFYLAADLFSFALKEENLFIWSLIFQVLLSTPGVVHTILTPTSFRAEYRRAGSGSSLLARPVKMQIDIVRASTGQAALNNSSTGDSASERELYAISFQLLSGRSLTKFKRPVSLS